MTLYSYIVKHDTGFAPNPFFGCCTLACCKPVIRSRAKEGDWIVGLTPAARGNRIVYFMRVDKILGIDGYWRDARFGKKKPRFGAGVEFKTGDNIYKPSGGGRFSQLPSPHSSPPLRKREQREAMKRDLRGERVLISETFVYFGSEAVELPDELKDLKVKRGHKCRFLPALVEEFIHCFVPKWETGVHAMPHRPPRNDEPWHGGSCGGA